jgi:hypothetical protein
MRVCCPAAENSNASLAGKLYPMLLIGTLKLQNGISARAPGSELSAPCCTGRPHLPPLFSKTAFFNALSPVTVPEHCMTISDSAHSTNAFDIKKIEKTVFDKIYSACKNLAIFQTACRTACIVCPDHLVNNRRCNTMSCTYYCNTA